MYCLYKAHFSSKDKYVQSERIEKEQGWLSNSQNKLKSEDLKGTRPLYIGERINLLTRTYKLTCIKQSSKIYEPNTYKA